MCVISPSWNLYGLLHMILRWKLIEQNRVGMSHSCGIVEDVISRVLCLVCGHV